MALTLYTYDWVPEFPRGYVRDVRVRWALEEAGFSYTVKTVSFKNRTAEHISHQPFAQVPYITHGDISIFESGAILLYLGELSEKLMPKRQRERAQALEWLVAALNSVEMASVPWSIFKFVQLPTDNPALQPIEGFLKLRLDRMEPVLRRRSDWLAGQFTVADILMVGCAAPGEPPRRPRRLSSSQGLCRTHYGAARFPKGLRRPDGAFCEGGLSSACFFFDQSRQHLIVTRAQIFLQVGIAHALVALPLDPFDAARREVGRGPQARLRLQKLIAHRRHLEGDAGMLAPAFRRIRSRTPCRRSSTHRHHPTGSHASHAAAFAEGVIG